MRKTYMDVLGQHGAVMARNRLAGLNGYGVFALNHDRVAIDKRRIPVVPGYGEYSESSEISPGAAVALGVGGLVLAGVLTLGGYMLFAYGVGWAATKGVQKARKKKKK